MAKVGSTMVMIIFILGVYVLNDVASAATFTVGDSGGWTFRVSDWPNGKTFAAGDTLVFKYPAGAHNVVIVSKDGYDSCENKARKNGQVFTSGNDQITLKKGDNYFICTFPTHCETGMKIAVHAN